MEWIKNALNWIIANSDTIMNWAVSASAIVLLLVKIFFTAKTTVNKIKSNEITVDNDTAMQTFKAEMLKKEQETLDKYMQNFDNKLAETTALFKTRQQRYEEEQQKQIETAAAETTAKIAALKKIKSEVSSDEKTTV